MGTKISEMLIREADFEGRLKGNESMLPKFGLEDRSILRSRKVFEETCPSHKVGRDFSKVKFPDEGTK